MENITEEQLAVLKEAISKLDASFSFEEKQNATTENLDNNIFHILKIEELEIRHTNFLEWLLKNNKLFLQEFLQHHNICGLSEIKASKLVADEFKTYNPYKIENGRLIDLVIKFPNQKYLIVIENKINSGEGVDQLHDYHKSIIEHSDFTEYEKKIYIFNSKRRYTRK